MILRMQEPLLRKVAPIQMQAGKLPVRFEFPVLMLQELLIR